MVSDQVMVELRGLGQRLTLDPDLTDAARDILKRLESGH
jgi:hypothetical protein